MSKYKMISPAVPNVPWQDKPENHEGAPLWRYTENPVIGRNPVEGVARIFNSAVIPYEGSLLVLDGTGKVQSGEECVEVQKGDSVFITANAGEYEMEEKFEALLTTV